MSGVGVGGSGSGVSLGVGRIFVCVGRGVSLGVGVEVAGDGVPGVGVSDGGFSGVSVRVGVDVLLLSGVMVGLFGTHNRWPA